MKKRIHLLLVVLISMFSLQSCVTNYVASAPTFYDKEYKADAKVAEMSPERLETNKRILINTFGSEAAAKQTALAAQKNTEIAANILLAQKVDQLLKEAQTYLGTPYRFGGMSRSGIDCSAFVLSVYGAAAGINLPRVAAAQAQEGETVSKEDLQKGDLIFFSHGGGRISHVAIVEDVTPEGEIRFIHAASSRGVMISTLNNDRYWAPKYRFAKRILTPEAMMAADANGSLAMNNLPKQ